jgi:hypothetical protein
MNRCARTLLLASMLVLPLVGCSSWDPTDIFDNSFFNPKKPLPGERKELFPQGTPGVQQGVPPELVKGYQPAATETQATVQPEAAPEESKPKPKAKPKPKVVVQQPARQPTAVTVRPPQTTAGSPWPDAPAPRSPSPAAAPASPWPDPPQTGQPQSAAPAPGGFAWPDPPKPGATSR